VGEGGQRGSYGLEVGRQRTAAAAGSAVFFALAPGTIVGLVPWTITHWHPGAPLSHLVPLRVLGAVLVVAGTAILVSAFARFVAEGFGTPAPVAPPARLALALVAWVYLLEQPELQSRFGAQYDEYRRAVPAWWPHLRPWQPR
jgi:hypothetical protein